MTKFSIPTPHGFELAAATQFYAGFTPGSGMAASSTERELVLSFRLDRTYEAVAVALRQDGQTIVGQASGSRDVKAIAGQISRMLGLDADGHAWAAIGERDPVVGRLQRKFPGFFTAAKASPYDAAVWSVIVPRMQMKQAARIKIAISTTHGDAVELLGQTYHVFPAPKVLAELETAKGLSEEKLVRLRGIGEAAIAGDLDVDRLRAMTSRDAVAKLQKLRGIGPWGASHIYYRGAAIADELPIAEPRVLHALALAYGLTDPSIEECQRVASAWQPFRMWVAILLMRELAQTPEWRAPHLREARSRRPRAATR